MARCRGPFCVLCLSTRCHGGPESGCAVQCLYVQYSRRIPHPPPGTTPRTLTHSPPSIPQSHAHALAPPPVTNHARTWCSGERAVHGHMLGFGPMPGDKRRLGPQTGPGGASVWPQIPDTRQTSAIHDPYQVGRRHVANTLRNRGPEVAPKCVNYARPPSPSCLFTYSIVIHAPRRSHCVCVPYVLSGGGCPSRSDLLCAGTLMPLLLPTRIHMIRPPPPLTPAAHSHPPCNRRSLPERLRTSRKLPEAA